MADQRVDTTWMWHPNFHENEAHCAGRFVHFRRTFDLPAEQVPSSFSIHITADTRYKLYVNRKLVSFGPVKGDAALWFYDEVDIGPYLKAGRNHIGVHVLRFFHATSYATSFPRLSSGGLRVQPVEHNAPLSAMVQSSAAWETAIDSYVKLRVDEPEDEFLHVYEYASLESQEPLQWVPSEILEFQNSTGQSAPWKLAPRMIPSLEMQYFRPCALHNLQSPIAHSAWSNTLLGSQEHVSGSSPLVLPAGSAHQVDIEFPHHMTAFVELHFKRPEMPGSTVTLMYAESYEDPPTLIPYLRRKSHRQDRSKDLFGPRDIYQLKGAAGFQELEYHGTEETEELVIPFHFRTFRFVRLNINVKDSDLVLSKIVVQEATYPLNVQAEIETSSDVDVQPLWQTSVRTLRNCMHDTYEDCPFYEQLQYAMDTRSSILFTYYASGDDRLARQAIIQLRNSFQAHVGLTASRAPSHSVQIIPHFSLYWVCMVCDHWQFNGDKGFVVQFLPVIDAILNYFGSRLHPSLHLVTCEDRPGIWNFHDWTEEWRPYGIPPAVTHTGVSTYTNCLYVYALNNAAALLQDVGRSALATEYSQRASSIKDAIFKHCFDGTYFTDSPNSPSKGHQQYSQHAQAWAVLCGAATGNIATKILHDSLQAQTRDTFIPTSISMSFYMLRALALAGKEVYAQHFHQFWDPWRKQLALGLTTWEEDDVSQRSDCHAWGCAPIYEFLAEVAGVRPVAPGWATIRFEPRLSLYRDFKATVSLPMIGNEKQGTVHVAWTSTPQNEISVVLGMAYQFSKF
ncbi:Six-hairpin glycosidase [Pyrenochaeta sp. DS3sAY3a]|nr:Six-hairpin glycosidase [Pyrenochaeta sp. DS3sAY3a]